MAYRDDKDLEFLKELKSKDLDGLVKILIYDKDGKKRLTEELSSHEKYNKHYPNHVKYWQEIAEELQKFGGNSLGNIILRGGDGVLYKEILQDVCDKLKVSYDKNSTVEVIENNLLMKILEESLEKMSPEERKEFAKDVGIKNLTNFSSATMLMAFQAIFKAGGFQSYQLTVIIANAVLQALIGTGLSFAANSALTKAMSILAGPVGWVVSSVWAAFDIASPAYRVTIPAVIEIAVLRKKYLYEKSL